MKIFMILFFVFALVEGFIIIFELIRPIPQNGSVRVFFGKPGAGKSTFCASFAKYYQKKGITVYSNVPIKGCIQVDRSDIGKYDISNGHLIIDEAGIDYNNRNFKSMPQDAIKWWKLIRHFHCSASVMSQSYDDMDITLRRLAHDTYIIKRSLIPGMFICKKFNMKIDIDESTHKPGDFYKWDLPVLGTYRIIGRRYWKMFDSYDAPELPSKEWNTYD